MVSGLQIRHAYGMLVMVLCMCLNTGLQEDWCPALCIRILHTRFLPSFGWRTPAGEPQRGHSLPLLAQAQLSALNEELPKIQQDAKQLLQASLEAASNDEDQQTLQAQQRTLAAHQEQVRVLLVIRTHLAQSARV